MACTKKHLLFVLSFSLLLTVVGCGSSKSNSNLPGEQFPPGTSNITVAVSPTSPSIDIGGSQPFTATVNGTSNRAVNWQVSGPGCGENDACGTIDASGMYRAPDDRPNPADVSIVAISQADTEKSGSTNVTIMTRTNSSFRDQYAFLLNGFEGSSAPVAIAGSFTSDGNGGIAAGGVMDLNRREGPQVNIRVTGGTYSFGADSRGRLTLYTEQGSFSFRFAMGAANPPRHEGRMILFQPGRSIEGSGIIKKQAGPLSMASLSGEFALASSGATSSGRAGAVGALSFNGAGQISGGAMDFNLSGMRFANLDASGTYSVNAADGRGTATVNTSAIGPLNLALYVLSSNEAFFVGLDARSMTLPMLSGSIVKKAGGSSMISGAIVFSVTGISDGSDVTVGRFDASNQQLSGTLDENKSGTITAQAAFLGAYSVASNGRGTMNFQLGPTSDMSYTFYMLAPNRAFLLQSDAPQVGVGLMEPQTGGPLATAGFSGNWTIGTADPSQCGCTAFSGVISLDGANGRFFGSRDRSRSDGLFPRGNWVGTFTVTGNGRGTATATIATPPAVENWVLYAVSPNKVVLIDVDTDLVAPTVTILEK